MITTLPLVLIIDHAVVQLGHIFKSLNHMQFVFKVYNYFDVAKSDVKQSYASIFYLQRLRYRAARKSCDSAIKFSNGKRNRLTMQQCIDNKYKEI